MKKILVLSFAAVIACMLVSCQRYPFLSYYIQVQNDQGINMLDTTSGPGKINVNDLWFEVIAGNMRDSLKVTSDEDASSDVIAASDTDSLTEDVDSVVVDSIAQTELVQRVFPFEFNVKFNNYSRPHLFVSTSVGIGTKLEDCPVFIIHWTDGKPDSLQIDNHNGTMGSPKYYVNGKKVKDQDQFITIKK